jgi:hypothetical protein
MPRQRLRNPQIPEEFAPFQVVDAEISALHGVCAAAHG